jgi:hypothetical protein
MRYFHMGIARELGAAFAPPGALPHSRLFVTNSL